MIVDKGLHYLQQKEKEYSSVGREGRGRKSSNLSRHFVYFVIFLSSSYLQMTVLIRQVQ